MNFKKIQAVVKHQFMWEKNSFLIAVAAILIAKIVFMIINPPMYIVFFGAIVTFFPAFSVIRPEFTVKDKSFSAKYILSFPLSRKELFIATTLIFILMAVPFMVWTICFYEQIYFIFSIIETSAMAVFNILCIAVFLGSFTLKNLLAKSRTVQVKLTFKELISNMAVGYAALAFISLFWVALSSFTELYFNWDMDNLFLKLPDYVNSPWFGAFLLACAFYKYVTSIDTSKSDIKSFRAPWSLKIVSIRVAGLGLASVICGYFAFSIPPAAFKGDLQSAIYLSDKESIKKLVNSSTDINRPNEFGVTPMMVALARGQINVVKILEKKGANYSGEVNRASDKFHGYDARLLAVSSGNIKLLNYIKDKVPSFNISNSLHTLHPIHVAASHCYAETSNYLIENGADIEVKNSKGQTPLVIAAHNNCFQNVISLAEAGARFDIKGSDGKLVLNDLGEDVNPELEHFIKKNLRAPANKN